MPPKKPNSERKLRLVSDNPNPEPSDHVEKAARAGERILTSVGYSKSTESLSDAEREKRLIAREANDISRLVKGLNEEYDARKLRDKNAGKLLKALSFIAQAGLSDERIDDFLENYTEPIDENDQEATRQTIEESARLTDSLISLEELLENLFDENGQFTPDNLAHFRREGNSPIWDNAKLKDRLLEAARVAYSVAAHKGAREGTGPMVWLYFCTSTIARDGMRLVEPDEEASEEAWDKLYDERDKKFDDAWKKWLPKLGPRDILI